MNAQTAAQSPVQVHTHAGVSAAKAVGVYKPGEGYWVRVMTAILGSLLALAAAAWAWQQSAAIPVPVGSHEVALRGLPETGAPLAVGSVVDIMSDRESTTNEFAKWGTGVVKAFEARSGGDAILTLRDVAMTEGKILAEANRVQTADGGLGASIGNVLAVQVFNQEYLQIGLALLVGAFGLALVYRYVASKHSSVEFLIATDGEMKKVNWSTRRMILTSTWVVLAATFLIAAFLFAADSAMSTIGKEIGLLQQ